MIPKSLVEKNFSLPDTELVKVNKLSLLKLAEEYFFKVVSNQKNNKINFCLKKRCFKICCKLKPECGSYWYDFGVNYFYQFNALKDTNQMVLITKSKECLINAINMEPENHKFWNFLGILYSTKGNLF